MWKMTENNMVTVVGAGLAGSEAAWQLAKRGIKVTLIDMKPNEKSPAHSQNGFGELVCSNSLKAMRIDSASGLLKEEMRRLGSLIIEAADSSSVPAGGALAVDRDKFSEYITKKLTEHENITIKAQRIDDIPEGNVIIATGPLTDGKLYESIAGLVGKDALGFYDAAAPIVRRDSINMEKAFLKSRYDRGEADYINCPMDKDQYDAFVNALLEAETAPVHGFEENLLFEGCMPVESMARRGFMTLAFGPLKPIGLEDPRTGKMPYAVVQLRQDDSAASVYNMVGFQTRLKFGEQKRVFSMIPGLENAVFERYGVMHRNTYIQSPGFLDEHYAVIGRENLCFAGQITGVEGYVESAGSGLVAGMDLANRLLGKKQSELTAKTMLGALAKYISSPHHKFDPMNANFSIIEQPAQRFRNKKDKYNAYAERSLAIIDELAGEQV